MGLDAGPKADGAVGGCLTFAGLGNKPFPTLNNQAALEKQTMTKLTDFERSAKLAEVRAVYKSSTKMSERAKIREPQDVVRYVRAIWNLNTLDLLEEFIVICLNNNHQALGWVKVSSGGFGMAEVDQRLVFSIALQTASSAIIMAHNHPSGSLEPSEADKSLTRRVKESGNLLGVPLLDHLILTREGHFSFQE
ncbi:MAG: JAB domain-containing protein, partial [Rhodopirellula sp.]|nr:JAB domain-containing protein [Rhodopirellula sp.]